jgi:putative transposase
MHCVFATKERRPLIGPGLQERLWPYLGGIARENKMRALGIGGVPDHVHMLISIPSTLAISKAIQLLKGNSSKWVHDTFPQHRDFEWQEGYGAFSLGISGVDETLKYIANQAEHHRKLTFHEEVIQFLRAASKIKEEVGVRRSGFRPEAGEHGG